MHVVTYWNTQCDSVSKEIDEEEKKATRISRIGRRNTVVYRLADGTTRKAMVKEKPVLKYGGFNPRGPLEQFHRVISFVATCDELTRRLSPSFRPLSSSFLRDQRR